MHLYRQFSIVLVTVATSLLLVSSHQHAKADLFHYTSKDGSLVIVDDEGKVPPEYRKKAKTNRSGQGTAERYTSVIVRGNKVLVPVTISFRHETVQARLLLDTGASITAITPALAARLGIRPEHTRQSVGRVADGSFITAQNTIVDYLMVGPKVKHNAEVAVLPMNGPAMGFDGLLGMNFLGDFRYHINLGSQTIEWVTH